MRKTYSILAAATIAAGSWAFLGYDQAVLGADQGASASASVSTDHNSNMGNLPQGVTRTDRADEAGVRRTLAGVVSAVLSEDQNGLSGLSQYLSTGDRARLNDLGKNDTMLRDKIAQLRRDLNAKYGQNFRADDEQAFNSSFKDFVIVQGEVSNPALLSNWPVEPTGRTNINGNTNEHGNIDTNTNTNIHTETGTNGQRRSEVSSPGSPPTGRFADKNNNGSSASISSSSSSSSSTTSGNAAANEGNISTRYDRGMNLAVATFPASHGAPEINVSLVRQTSANIHENGGARGEVNTTTTGSTGHVTTDNARRAEVSGPGRPATGDVNTGTARESTSTDNTRRAEVGGPGTPPTGAIGNAHESTSVQTNTGTTSNGAAANMAMGDWKVDLPNTVTSERLEKDLAMHLDEVDRMKDQWPADATEGYRMVAHHIFMALYDVNGNENAGK